MLFSSIIFIFYFLPAFLLFYFLSGMRTAVLLTGSLLFYTWGEGEYVFLLAGLIVLNYGLARILSLRDGRSRLILFLLAIVVDVGVLGLFKYGSFTVDVVHSLAGRSFLPKADFKLPLGISFFTFQLVSYLADVYRRQVDVEMSLARFATYILMFPHLIAGPIVRYADIRAELVSRQQDWDRFGLGVQYFIVGLSQKVLIANTLAPVADYSFSLGPGVLTAMPAWIGIVAYTLQIFFDFCGYSNMAIGMAFMLGFSFPKNFDYPYAARSISDFWRRWHMSLSFWFRDYVYIPLGGNRKGAAATVRNLLIVFFLTGLWHGAAWNFIFWGLFHGVFLLVERLWLGNRLVAAPAPLAWSYAMLVVMVGWVFFRADDFGHAFRYVGEMFTPGAGESLPLGLVVLMSPEVITAFVLGAILSFPVVPALMDRIGRPRVGRHLAHAEQRLDTHYVHALPVSLLLVGFLLSSALLVSNTLNPFLYFRF